MTGNEQSEKDLGQKFDEWAGFLFIVLFVGIPVWAYSLLRHPVETVRWFRNGGGHPGPGAGQRD